MPRTPVLEIAVQDVAGVRVAAEVGAARVELCVALGATGGLTSSLGLVEAVVDAARSATRTDGRDLPLEPLEVHALVRARAGGFVYDADELGVHLRDVRALVAAGAAGVVVGALTPAGEVDTAQVARLVGAASGAEVTFHRAIDTLVDPLAAVETLCGLGVTRILTSGGAQRSVDGAEQLQQMVEVAAGRLQVMAGGGVRPVDVATLVAVGVDAVHLSAKGVVAADGGVGGGAGAGVEVTDPVVARAAADALRGATA
jgi:copper homeostasis protein